MTSANEKQVGGDHYQNDYQHWDMVIDISMPYVPACATKYVSRWRHKNGLQDLEKARHYLEKALERRDDCETYVLPSERDSVERFCAQLEDADATIVRLIAEDKFEDALVVLDEMIKDVATAAGLATESPKQEPQG